MPDIRSTAGRSDASLAPVDTKRSHLSSDGPGFRSSLPYLYALLIVALLAGFFAPYALRSAYAAPAAAPEAAKGVAFPTYAYAIASGAYTYDVILNKGGKETRLSRIGVAGVGFTDIAVRTSPDRARVAVRLNGNASGGSSLRVIEISSSKAITTTARTGAGEGVGTFAWSPDSKTLAYTLAAPQKVDADKGFGTVWIISSEGKWPRKISGRGADRLVGWSPDGTGLYVERSSGDGKLLSLYYYHLAGDSREVLLARAATKNDPGVNYSRFAISAATVATTTLGAARVGMVASGGVSTLPLAEGATAPTVPTATKSGAAPVPFLFVGDGVFYRPMVGDSEQYSALNWTPDGYRLLASGGKSGKGWIIDAASGERWAMATQVNNMAPIAWSEDSRYALMAPTSGPATTLMTLDTMSGKLNASRWVGKGLVADDPAKSLIVPYINQVWDTSNAVSGVWACGPTSVAMVLAAFGRLEPWPLPAGSTRNTAQNGNRGPSALAEPASLVEDGRLYARYITEAFQYKGRDFSATSKDPNGRKVAGLYGTIVAADTLAHWDKMISVLELYDLQTDYLNVSWASITAALDKGYPVIVGTNLTQTGHILVAKGYTKNGFLIVNDPYGNKWGDSGYGGPDGKNIAYPWNKMTAKMALIVKGTVWVPTPTPTPTLPATATPTFTPTATPEPTSTPMPD